jgi:M6 family metalloprotease-like protein
MGQGCVADYFRDQSAGRLNLVFDIYGPVKIDKGVLSHYYYDDGWEDMRKALELLPETTDADFSVYDWNGDGQANEVVFVAAGLIGNTMNGNHYLVPGSYFQITKSWVTMPPLPSTICKGVACRRHQPRASAYKGEN